MSTSFPIETLPEPLRSYVRQGAQALRCDPSYIAVPLLPALGSAIGNARRIRLKATWTEPPVIWSATVGDSGTAKSPGFDLAIRAVWNRQRSILRSYTQARQEYEEERREWKALPKKERGDEPQPPAACEHLLCSDITVEALADRLAATPRGTLVALDELGGWFGSFNAYKSGGGSDVSHWLAMHGARSLKVDRKTGDRRTIYVPHAAVSVTGTIQPGTLHRALPPEYVENGLSARLLVAMPPTRPKRWTESEIDPELLVRVDSLFNNLYGLSMAPDPTGYDEPLLVDMDGAGKAVWIDFYNTHNGQLDCLDRADRSAWAKLEGYGARFALLHHCCRQAAGTKDSDHVDVTDVEAGVALTRWFGEEGQRVFRLLGESDDERHRRELRQWIAGRRGRVTVRDLQRGPRRFRVNPDMAEIALNELADMACGSWEPMASTERGGRPTMVFYLADSPDFPITNNGDGDETPESIGNQTVLSPSPL